MCFTVIVVGAAEQFGKFFGKVNLYARIPFGVLIRLDGGVIGEGVLAFQGCEARRSSPATGLVRHVVAIVGVECSDVNEERPVCIVIVVGEVEVCTEVTKVAFRKFRDSG